jgi:hypothetical protein
VSPLQELPPDLRATLSLLLEQRKRYGEIAALLKIEQRAVHDRAHAALALLAPREARGLSAEEREQVGEYLLGQAAPEQRAATVARLERSDAARAWAAALAAELDPLAGELPAIPAGGEPSAPRSHRGGAILLAGLAAAVIVAVVLIVTLGGGSSPSAPAGSPAASAQASGGSSAATTPAASAPSGAGKSGTSSASGSAGATGTSGKAGTAGSSGKSSTTGTSGKSASEPHLDATLPLQPPSSSSKALGLVEVLSEGGEHAFILAAEHLPPTRGFHYAAWLYNTPTDAFFLGGGTSVGSNGILKAAQGLPPDAARYATIVLTEEHAERPKQPGPIVLSGPFKL